MKHRIRKILTNLESVREDLIALSDDIWLNIDHNNSEKVREGAEFKITYNECVKAFEDDAECLSELVQNFTKISLDEESCESTDDSQEIIRKRRERIIQESDRHTPHSLDEDFRYKRPFGFSIEGTPYFPRHTWSLIFRSVCKYFSVKSPEKFKEMPNQPDFISSRGNSYFSKNPKELRKAKNMGFGVFAETNLSANGIRDVIKSLLLYFEIPQSEFIVYLREDRDADG